jgi:hypothetical protein
MEGSHIIFFQVEASLDLEGTQFSEEPRADWRFESGPHVVEGRSRAARIFRGLFEGCPHILRADLRAALNQALMNNQSQEDS